MLTPAQKPAVQHILGNVGITYNEDAESVEALIDGARLNGKPLDQRQRKIVRKGLRTIGIKDEPKYARPGYRSFVEYIALNDDRYGLDNNLPSVCVSMVAHMFGKETDDVIADVQEYLEKAGG